MNIWESLIGTGEELTIFQMSFRALVIYFVTLILMRLSGIRILARKSALDNIIMILLVAVLARAVVGASPMPSTIAAAFAIVFINKLITAWALHNKTVSYLCKGREVVLFEHGRILEENLRKADVSKGDLMESLRLETNAQDWDKVLKATLETNGRISFVIKEKGY